MPKALLAGYRKLLHKAMQFRRKIAAHRLRVGAASGGHLLQKQRQLRLLLCRGGGRSPNRQARRAWDSSVFQNLLPQCRDHHAAQQHPAQVVELPPVIRVKSKQGAHCQRLREQLQELLRQFFQPFKIAAAYPLKAGAQ